MGAEENTVKWKGRTSPASSGDIPVLDEDRMKSSRCSLCSLWLLKQHNSQPGSFPLLQIPSAPQEREIKEEKIINCSWFLQGRWIRNPLSAPELYKSCRMWDQHHNQEKS